jgi:hypothetical protein
MPQVGFEPKVLVFERAKTVHALDRAVTVIGCILTIEITFYGLATPRQKVSVSLRTKTKWKEIVEQEARMRTEANIKQV